MLLLRLRKGFVSSRARLPQVALTLPSVSSTSSSTLWSSTLMAMGMVTSSTLAYQSSESESSETMASSTAHPFKVKPRVFFVLGGPGSGKGTQCSKVVHDYGFVHLSAGDLLRAERNSGSENGEMIDRLILEGKIVPVKVTLGLLKNAMEKSAQHLFLIDGFPRNYDNLQGWESIMTDVKVEGVIFYDCSEETMEGRLLERGKTSGRTDDNVEAIRKRFATYKDSTMPVIDYYEKQDLVHTISAAPSAEVVFKSTKKVVEPVLRDYLLELNQNLLDAISEGNLSVYKELCDEEMTAFEPEASGQLLKGLKFHEFYFENSSKKPSTNSSSTIVNASVRLLGDTAVVSYVRLIQSFEKNAQPTSTAFEETRIWKRMESGHWKNVHFHRSKPTTPSH